MVFFSFDSYAFVTVNFFDGAVLGAVGCSPLRLWAWWKVISYRLFWVKV